MYLGVDILGVEDGLGDFLAQELRMATAKAVDQRFEAGQPSSASAPPLRRSDRPERRRRRERAAGCGRFQLCRALPAPVPSAAWRGLV
jgi:hypothetical protein